MSYALGQWSRVEAYLQNPHLRPDNNAAENAIRPFTVGRKNWLFSGSPRGAKVSTALYSMIETAKGNSVDPYQYLLYAYAGVDFYNATKATFHKLDRIDMRDYPVDAISEALLNAIIHRDYSFSGSIFINIYSDKIEIISLGGLVAGLSVDAIMFGASQPRNEKLAALFYRMKLIESYGIGIVKILNSYKEYSVKPKFDTLQGAFRVTLPNVNAIEHSLNKSHDAVIEYVEEHGSIRRSEIEELLSVKLTRANTIIKEMLGLGLIIKENKGRHTVYRLPCA